MNKDIVLDRVRRYFSSYWYLGTVAAIILVFYFTPFSYVGLAILALLLATTFIVCDDGRTYLPVILMVVYVVNYDIVYANLNLLLIVGGILVAIVLASMIYRLVRILKTKNYKFGTFSLPFVILVVTMSLGGLFADFDILAMLAILGVGVIVFLVYFLMINTIKQNFKHYLCLICIAIGIIVLIELVGFYVTVEDFWGAIDNKTIALGWGISNNIGMVLVVIIPIALYMSTKARYGAVYLALAVLLYLTLLMTFSRGCILFCTLLMPFMLVFTFVKSRNKLMSGLVILAFLFILTVGLILYFDEIMRIFQKMIETGFDDNGRIKLFIVSSEMFFKNPIFGSGFAIPEGSDQQVFFKAHNTFLQQLASCGIIGLLGSIPYYYVIYSRFFKKISVFKVFAFCAVLTFDLYGLMDLSIVMLYINLIIYCLMYASELEDDGRCVIKKLSYKPLQNAC